MKVPFFEYRSAYTRLKPEIDAAIGRVLDSAQLILGPEGRALETEFAAYTGAAAGIGVNSGTDAIALALKALEVGPGDEVITVANAGVPPVAAIRMAGATPRFVDVHPGTLLMDPDALEGALTPHTRCVLPVHLYGQPVPLEPVVEFAARHGLHIVEDCAQAHGATYRGRHVGVFGAIGCFSFYPTKNLGAFGDGGMCITDDPALEDRLRMLRQYGFKEDRHAHCEGVNSRLDELQAAILRVRLRHLNRSIEERREIAQLYTDQLNGSSFRMLEAVDGAHHAFHLFVIQAADRGRLISALERASVGFGIHYPEPVHLMQAYRILGQGKGALPVSEQSCETVLSLPLFEGMEIDAARWVARAVLDAG